MLRLRFMILPALLLAAGCQGIHWSSDPGTRTLATIPPAELRDILAGLSRSHGQKVQLEFYIALPWKGLDAPYGDFFYRMASQQAALDKQLQAWARKRDLDLTYHFGDDVMSQAQKTMEDRQSDIILSDNRADLTRDVVIQMYMDYEFQICILLNLAPKVLDPDLKAYVERSLKVHQDGSKELAALLKRFKAM